MSYTFFSLRRIYYVKSVIERLCMCVCVNQISIVPCKDHVSENWTHYSDSPIIDSFFEEFKHQ